MAQYGSHAVLQQQAAYSVIYHNLVRLISNVGTRYSMDATHVVSTRAARGQYASLYKNAVVGGELAACHSAASELMLVFVDAARTADELSSIFWLLEKLTTFD